VTDVGGNVTIKIDKDGAVDGVDFTNAHQTIVLEGVGTGSINLNYLDDYAILL